MSTKPRILLVDDDRNLAGFTKEYLEAKDFLVSMHHNAEAGLQAFKNGAFDICIFDVKMPVKDGFSLAEDIRTLDTNIPIIFLTGQTEQADRIRGLTIGADDYITKPFSMQELFLRLKVVLKHLRFEQRSRLSAYQLGKYSYDPVSRTLTIGDQTNRLSEMEGQLLVLFCTEPKGKVSRDLALRRIWNDEDHVKGRSLNVYITKLRRRLNGDPDVEILNVHGTGYQLVVKNSS